MINAFTKWLNTPAVIKRLSGINNYGQPNFLPDVNTACYIFPLTTEELSAFAIKAKASHRVYFIEEIEMSDTLDVDGVLSKTPARVEKFYDHRGFFNHSEVLL